MSGPSITGRAIGLVALFAVSLLRAQTPAATQFDDLSRRAQAALDSHPQEAAQLYKQALAIRPDWPEGWLYMGGALYQAGRYAEATDALRKGLNLAPVFANGWALLGLSESQLDDPDQALADIKKGEELGLNGNVPFETAVRARAAQLLIRSSAFDEALAQLQPLARYPDEPAPVSETMGLCALASQDDIAALTPQRRAVVDLAGKAAWAFATQHPDEAGAAYKQLVAQYPDEPGVHYAYGLFLMETDVKQALAEFQKEAQIDPKHWPALLVIASLQIRQGEPAKAIESLRAAMKTAPAKYHWLCHLNLGHAELDAGNSAAAISELESASRQMPSSANAHFFLAEAYRAAGRRADADREKSEFEKRKVEEDRLGVPAFHPFGASGKNQ
jgi:tetratricopeptide (TPR) repeat protein